MRKDRTGKIQGLQFCKGLFKDSRFQFAFSFKGFPKHFFAAITKFIFFKPTVTGNGLRDYTHMHREGCGCATFSTCEILHQNPAHDLFCAASPLLRFPPPLSLASPAPAAPCFGASERPNRRQGIRLLRVHNECDRHSSPAPPEKKRKRTLSIYQTRQSKKRDGHRWVRFEREKKWLLAQLTGTC